MTLNESLHSEKLREAKKKLVRILKSPVGRQAHEQLTGIRIGFEDEVEREQLPLVAILTPAYKTRVGEAWDAVERMILASRGHCRPFIEPRYTSSVVHWTRNSELAGLLKSRKPFDYVLFIDDDIIPEPDYLVKMVSHKKDFVGAACTVRRDPPVPNFRIYTPENYTFHTCFNWKANELIGGLDYGIGAGMILISHDCLKKVAEYYINCEYEKKFYGLSGDMLEKLQAGRQEEATKTGDFWWFEFLKHPLGRGEFGEDIAFCFKMIQLGLPVYIDTSLQPKHVGDYGYSLSDYHGSYQRAVMEEMLQEDAQTNLLGIPGDEENHEGMSVQPDFNDPLLGAPMQEAS
jgi:hypothetical protein